MKLRTALSSLRFIAAAVGLAVLVWSLSSRTPATEPPAPIPFAVIDVNKVLTSSKAGKAAYDSLKRMQEEKMQKGRELDAEIKALQTAFDALPKGAATTAEKGKQLADKRVAMQRFGQDSEREIGEARDRALAALEIKIKPVIDAVAKEMSLALVFNKFESGLVYASDQTDITETVITRFNAVTP